MSEVKAGVEKAKVLLSDCGIDIDVTADQLWDWFDSQAPIPDIVLGDVVVDPLLVAHELVEIDEFLKMGLSITRESVAQNPGMVDNAHLKAARVELVVAKAVGAADHIGDRISDMERWCEDKALNQRRRDEYVELLAEAKRCLHDLSRH